LFGLLIIVLIIIFGGMLALLGDRVGMKVGKKRLTIFGLRPKYTSMIITVLTGFFIAGLTLLVLTLLSGYVRTAIFELRNIQENLKLTTGKVKILTKQMTRKETEYAGLTLKHHQLQVQKGKIEEQLEKVRGEHQQVTHELTAKLKELDAKQAELKVKQERVNNLSQINDDLTKDIINKELEINRYTQQIENLEGDLMHLSSVNDRNQTMMTKPILFLVGEILAARVVEPGVSSDKVFENIVEPMLNSANEIAFNRGARIPGKTNYALRTTPRRVAEVCVQLTELKTKAVVRVVVEKNSVADEPVTATIQVFPNQIVFKSGEIVAETKVSGKQPESEIRDYILSLLILGVKVY
jgi:uncharacterized protein (DUF3084 family)